MINVGASREIRLSWDGITADADNMKTMSTPEEIEVASSILYLSRALMQQSRNSPGRRPIVGKLVELQKQLDGCSERLLVIQGFRVLGSMVGRGRFTAQVGDHTYVIE